MKKVFYFFVNTALAGLLLIIPLYLAILLLAKGIKSVMGLMQPIAKLIPGSLPVNEVIALVFVLALCFFVGLILRSRLGQIGRQWIERRFFERIPGYALFRSLTERMAGRSDENAWKPALVEIKNSLAPSFIIEELTDGRYTVFVPSVPTPFAGAVYVMESSRVHPVDVPFTDAIRVISRWGSGAQTLVAAMEKAKGK